MTPRLLTHRRTRVSAAVMLVAAAGAVAACASTQTPAALSQAESIYATLQSAHADQRVEGDMIRTRATLDTAQTAVTRGLTQDYTDGIADIALRTAETAEAHYARVLALQSADSLQKLRLSRQLALSQARQAALEAKQAALERQTAAANARADSLRRAADAALRADSLRRAADAATAGNAPSAIPGTADSTPRPAADSAPRP
jgi:hypothetical protein